MKTLKSDKTEALKLKRENKKLKEKLKYWEEQQNYLFRNKVEAIGYYANQFQEQMSLLKQRLLILTNENKELREENLVLKSMIGGEK